MKIGVLSLQGNYGRHLSALESINVGSSEVKYSKDLDNIDGLIIPGGESTTITRLIDEQNMHLDIYDYAKVNPVFGTCAGLIMLSSNVLSFNERDVKVEPFNILNLKVSRNGWGRQINSFNSKVDIQSFSAPYLGVFIRAPKVLEVDKDIEVLASIDQSPVMLRKGHILATTFHPELTHDLRVHEYFVNMISESIARC